MCFIRDEIALEAVQLYFAGIAILAFLTYQTLNTYVITVVRDIAIRI